MKPVKAPEFGSALERAARGNADIRLFLITGEEAGASEQVARLARLMGDAAERVDLDGATLKAHPGRLADEASSLSLFGDRRWIRVRGMGEESLDAVELLLAAPTAGNPVIAHAPTAKATGKLMKAATAARTAMLLTCYPLEGRDAERVAADLACEAGLRLAPGVAALLAESAAGDRAVLTREVEKLALYCDAAPDRPRDADADALAAIGAGIDDSGVGRAILAIIGGLPDALGADLAALRTDNMTVPLLRQLAKRLIALAEMRAEVDAGNSPDRVVEAARVFWKERDATTKALRRMTADALTAAIAQVRRAERAVMSSGTAGDVIAGQSLVTLARMTARR